MRLLRDNIIKWDMAETAKGGPFQEILDGKPLTPAVGFALISTDRSGHLRQLHLPLGPHPEIRHFRFHGPSRREPTAQRRRRCLMRVRPVPLRKSPSSLWLYRAARQTPTTPSRFTTSTRPSPPLPSRSTPKASASDVPSSPSIIYPPS